jgi:hypothetical protein
MGLMGINGGVMMGIKMILCNGIDGQYYTGPG